MERSCLGQQSSTDELDVNAQCNAAFQHWLAKLKTSPKPISPAGIKAERIDMKTGNGILDQFQPYDVGVAFFFFFIFSYCPAMPDSPAFMRRPRHRRTDDAPRVEISDWVRIMARRCEASLQTHCSFGFVSCN
jgi:hypothetical protein